MDKEEKQIFISYCICGVALIAVVLSIAIPILIGKSMKYNHEEKMYQLQNYGEIVWMEGEE